MVVKPDIKWPDLGQILAIIVYLDRLQLTFPGITALSQHCANGAGFRYLL